MAARSTEGVPCRHRRLRPQAVILAAPEALRHVPFSIQRSGRASRQWTDRWPGHPKLTWPSYLGRYPERSPVQVNVFAGQPRSLAVPSQLSLAEGGL